MLLGLSHSLPDSEQYGELKPPLTASSGWGIIALAGLRSAEDSDAMTDHYVLLFVCLVF